jgi:hypothetical protein
LGAIAVAAPDYTGGVFSSTNAGDSQRNVRYAYLVGRLRNRQMTMEEATELFGVMQGMLRQSEVARAAALRAPPPPPPMGYPPPAVPRPPAVAPVGGADDFFLLGLLAMGAGAGLLAALTKRIQDLTTPAAPTNRGNAGSGASTR